MAHGKTLDLIQLSRVFKTLQEANRTFVHGNPDHYHAKGAAGRPHASVRPELGDRRRYRAIVRRERQEAEQVRNRARLKRYGVDEIPDL